MRSSRITQCDHLNFFSKQRKYIHDFLLSTKSLAKISYPDDSVVTYQSVEDYGEKWHRFCLSLTSHRDFLFKHLNISFSENKLIVDLNSNCDDCIVQKNRRKVALFWQTDMVEFLIDERKLMMMKPDYIWFHLSTAFNSKKLFNNNNKYFFSCLGC